MVLETILLATSIASLATTEITGKGVTDHAISIASGKDCRISNTLRGDGICEPRGSVTVASGSGYSGNNNAVIEMEKLFARRKEQNNGR